MKRAPSKHDAPGPRRIATPAPRRSGPVPRDARGATGATPPAAHAEVDAVEADLRGDPRYDKD